MLTLERKLNEEIKIDLRAFGLGVATIAPIRLRKGRVCIGVECDRRIPVHRAEIFDAIESAKQPETAP